MTWEYPSELLRLTGENKRLEAEVARLNDMLRSEKQDRIKAEFEVTQLTSKLQVIKRANLLAAAVWKGNNDVDDLSDGDDMILINTVNEIEKQLEDVDPIKISMTADLVLEDPTGFRFIRHALDDIYEFSPNPGAVELKNAVISLTEFLRMNKELISKERKRYG